MRNAIADVQQIPNTSDVQMKAVDLMNPETFHCEEKINCSKKARKGWNPCLSGLFDLRYDWVSRSESVATLSFGKTWRRRPRFAILLTVHLQYFTAQYEFYTLRLPPCHMQRHESVQGSAGCRHWQGQTCKRVTIFINF